MRNYQIIPWEGRFFVYFSFEKMTPPRPGEENNLPSQAHERPPIYFFSPKNTFQDGYPRKNRRDWKGNCSHAEEQRYYMRISWKCINNFSVIPRWTVEHMYYKPIYKDILTLMCRYKMTIIFKPQKTSGKNESSGT